MNNVIYRKYTTDKGIKYSKNGKFIAADKINPNILEILSTVDELVDQGRWCLFCGKQSKLSKMINTQHIYLCDEHYYATNIGQIAAKLRELHNEEHESEKEH